MTGPACGNNPNYRMSDGDRQAVDSFRAYLTARGALRDRIAAALYNHSHPGWAISFPDLDQGQRDTYLARADAVLAELPRRTAGDVAAVIGPTMLLGLQDAELDGEGGTQRIHDWIKWISETVAALPAVLPAITNHDTDTSGVELRGDTEIRVAVLREAADAVAALDRRKVGITADTIRDAWEEGRDEGADLLRRMADETPATETCPTPETHNWGCGCPSDEHPSALGTLPAWLHQRFDPRGPDWEQLDEDDRSYWAHQARAVRRAVARGGFKQPAAGARQDGTQK